MHEQQHHTPADTVEARLSSYAINHFSLYSSEVEPASFFTELDVTYSISIQIYALDAHER